MALEPRLCAPIGQKPLVLRVLWESRLEKVRLAERAGSSPRIGHDLPRVLRRIRDALAVDGGSWRSLREVMLFDRNKLYVLKPAARVHWTETAALNDADALAATLLADTRSVDE